MTGTGTQNDPFLVDNWADFMTIDTNSAEIYVRWADTGNKIIDFNNIQPEGFSETVTFPAHVDFNGWTLKNFHSTASGSSFACSSVPDATVENLILENFYINSQGLISGAVLLKNCIMSGMMQSIGYVNAFSGGGLQRCSLNIKVNAINCTFMSGGGYLTPKSQITNSDVILDISCSGSTVSICEHSIKNSRISGKIQSNAQKITLGSSSSMSNVFNIEANSPLYYKSSGISVYNADFAEKSSDSNENFTGVTSEQLKNAEYLYNIGFPIGAES